MGIVPFTVCSVGRQRSLFQSEKTVRYLVKKRMCREGFKVNHNSNLEIRSLSLSFLVETKRKGGEYGEL